MIINPSSLDFEEHDIALTLLKELIEKKENITLHVTFSWTDLADLHSAIHAEQMAGAIWARILSGDPVTDDQKSMYKELMADSKSHLEDVARLLLQAVKEHYNYGRVSE